MNFVPAVSYHFCLSLLAAFTQPGQSLVAGPCTFVCGARAREGGEKHSKHVVRELREEEEEKEGSVGS